MSDGDGKPAEKPEPLSDEFCSHILEALGNKFADAPAEIRGAVLALATEGDAGGGLFTLWTSPLKHEVRRVARERLTKWVTDALLGAGPSRDAS